MNLVGRIFVVAKRVFGAFTAAGGALLVALTGWSCLRGAQSPAAAAAYAVLGIVLIVVGAVFMRAPLLRSTRPQLPDHGKSTQDR